MSDQAATAQQPDGEERSQGGSTSGSSSRPQEGQRASGRPRHRRRHQSQQQQGQQQQQRNLEAAINLDELRELMEMIDSHGFTEFELEREGFRIRLGRSVGGRAFESSAASGAAQTALRAEPVTHAASDAVIGQSMQPVTTPHPGAHAQAAASEDEGLHIITSPILGTFYRSPSPTAEPFVRIGSRVEHDSVVCIIEAMKLMNEIQSEVSGEVVKIYVENGQAVEYGQPLFGIKTK